MATGTPPTYDQARNAGFLALAHNPRWVSQANVTAAEADPETGASFVDLDPNDTGQISSVLVEVLLREKPGHQRAWVNVAAAGVHNTTLYRVTIDGTNCDYTSDGSATEQEILDGLEAEILVQITGIPLLVTVTQAVIGTKTYLLVERTTATTMTVAVGSADLEVEIEASSVTFDIWSVAKNRTIPVQVDGYIAKTVTKNWTQRVFIAGCAKSKVVYTATNGRVATAIGIGDLPGATI